LDFKSLSFRSAVLSALMLVTLLGIWYVATANSGPSASLAGLSAEQIEYAKMMGKDPGAGKSGGFPTLGQMGSTVWGTKALPFN
jgi:nitrate/nitrite transport system permease protein